MIQRHSIKKIPRIFMPLAVLIGTIILFYYLIQHNYSYRLIGILCALFAIPIGVIACYIPSIRITVIIIIITILCGLTRTASLHYSYHSFPFSNKPTIIHGIIINKEKIDRSLMDQCITIALTSIERENFSFKTNHQIQIYTKSTPNLEISDQVTIENITIKKPKNAAFWDYLIKEGIIATVFTKKLEYTITHRSTFSIRRIFFTYKNNLLLQFQNQLSPATFHLFASLFLGAKNKKALEIVRRQFQYWGILHYLARSGLHLAIVITIYEAVFRFIPLSFIVQQLFLLIMGILYFLLSWPSISFIRAFIMFLYYKLSILLRLPTHFLHILLATCYIVLLTNPMQLFFLDFQLSFCLTFALGWLNLYRTD